MRAAEKRRIIGAPALDLIEDAVVLLRAAPLSIHLLYYIGAIPFWLGFLYFISDMTRDAYAFERLAGGSLLVALLYLWNKCWQAVHSAKLRAILGGRPDDPWTRRRIIRMIGIQVSYQPWGLIARGIAAMILVPFAWASNFYQNIVALGDGSDSGKSLAGRAWEQAQLWPRQAHAAISIIYLFTFFVWVNSSLILGALPALLKIFFAVETAFSRGSLWSLYFNTTFFGASVALTSLAVDPLRRAVYAIRCFRGEALHSGNDLSAELVRIQIKPALAAVALAAMMLTLAPASRADTPVEAPRTADATEVDRRISEVLERREFAWRSPRDQKAIEKEQSGWTGAITRWFEHMGKQIDEGVTKALNWIKNQFKRSITPPTVSAPSGVDWAGLGKALLVILGIALVGVLVWLGMKLWRERRPKTVLASATPVVMPDLTSENVVANQLPEDGWLTLAREHAARGELTLALRAAWLAGLAHLGHRELIGISRHKTNRDYDRELRRRARDRAPMLNAFDDNLRNFERSWYGKHPVTQEKLDAFDENLDRIRES